MPDVGFSQVIGRARAKERNRRWFPKYRPSSRVYLEYAQEYAGEHIVVLHIGAGRDSLDVTRRLTGRCVVSVDVDPSGLVRNPNHRRVVADATCLPFADASCNMALFDNVFEHLANPEQALREANRVLVECGRLIFLCPNRLSYISVIGRLTPHRFHIWFRGLLSPTAEQDTFETYYRLNTVRVIRSLAQTMGFTIERLDSYVGWPSYWEFSDLLHRMAVVVHWLIERGPRAFHISLVGVLRKAPALEHKVKG